MGCFYSHLLKTNFKVIIFGLDAAGKISIINYLKNKIGDNTYNGSIGRFLYIDPKLYYKGLSVIEI